MNGDITFSGTFDVDWHFENLTSEQVRALTDAVVFAIRPFMVDTKTWRQPEVEVKMKPDREE